MSGNREPTMTGDIVIEARETGLTALIAARENLVRSTRKPKALSPKEVLVQEEVEEIAPRFSEEEEVFIRLYCSNPGLSIKDATKKAFGRKLKTKSALVAKAETLSSRQDIIEEIESRLEFNKARASYSEEDVLELLWKEATNPDTKSSTARLNALQLLGKHIGMFSKADEKVAEKTKGPTFNIVSYTPPTNGSGIPNEESAILTNGSGIQGEVNIPHMTQDNQKIEVNNGSKD